MAPPPLPPPPPELALPITLRPRIAKTVGWLLFDGFFSYLWIIGGQWYGYVLGVLLGLHALNRLSQLIPGSSRLVIDEPGITVRSFWRDRFIAWEHIESFSNVSDWGRAIAEPVQIRFTATAPTDTPFLKNDNQGVIPGFGHSPRRLIDLLTHCQIGRAHV